MRARLSVLLLAASLLTGCYVSHEVESPDATDAGQDSRVAMADGGSFEDAEPPDAGVEATDAAVAIRDGGPPPPPPLLGELACGDLFRWVNPLPHGRWARAVFGAAPDDVWVGGDGPRLQHWDGERFESWELPEVPNHWFSILALHGSARDNVWALVGSIPRGPSGPFQSYGILRFDGTAWQILTNRGLEELRPSQFTKALWVIGPEEAFIGGLGRIYHFSGDDFEVATAPATPLGLWSSPSGDVWASAERSVSVYRPDEGMWENVAIYSAPGRVLDLIGFADDEIYWAGGGELSRYNGFETQRPFPDEPLTARHLAGRGPRDFFALSSHFDGESWAHGDGIPNSLDMHAVGPAEAFAVGHFGNRFRITRGRTELLDSVTVSTNSLAGSPNHVLVSAESPSGTRVFQWDGVRLQTQLLDPSMGRGALLAASPDGGEFALTQNGLFRRRGEDWEQLARGHIPAIGVHARAVDDLWFWTARGDAVRHWDGARIEEFTVPPATHFTSVATLASEVWLAGEDGYLAHSEASGWREAEVPVAGLRYHVQNDLDGGLWLTGTDSAGLHMVYRREGDAWVREARMEAGRDRPPVILSRSEAYAYTSDGVGLVHRFDGTAWGNWVCRDVVDLHRTACGDVWLRTGGGGLLRSVSPPSACRY